MPVNEPLPFDVYRERLSSHYLGFALWDPAPDPTINVRVSIGDVGFVRDGAFRRMFNVILKHDDSSNQKIDKPDPYYPLACDPLVNLRRPSLPGRDYPSRQLSTEENTHNPLVAVTPKAAEGFTYECQGVGALLSLPTEADREEVLRTKVFENYIRDNVVSWFAWSQKNGLGVERMEDLILVTGCTLAQSWAVAAFCDPIAKSKVSLSVRPHPSKDGRSIFTWSNIHGSVMNNNSRHDTIKPPSNQCVFIKGFRAKRVLFWTTTLRAAAEPLPDDPDNRDEDEIQVTSVPYAPKYRDPLVAVLDYIAEKCPEGTIAIAHDDDLDLIKDVETLTADAVEKFLHDNQVPVLIENGAAIVRGPEEGPPVPDEAKSLWVSISKLRRNPPPLFPSPFRQPVPGNESVDMMAAISSCHYPAAGLATQPVVLPPQAPRPGYGHSLSLRPLNPSIPPPHANLRHAPPAVFARAPPIVHAHAGALPSHGAMRYPYPPTMRPMHHAPVPGMNRNMPMVQSQPFGGAQGMGIREPGFRMDPPYRFQTTGNEARYYADYNEHNQDPGVSSTTGLSDNVVPISGNTGRHLQQNTGPPVTAHCHVCLASISSEVDERFNGFCSDAHMWHAIHDKTAPLCQRCRQRACRSGNAFCGGVVCNNQGDHY